MDNISRIVRNGDSELRCLILTISLLWPTAIRVCAFHYGITAVMLTPIRALLLARMNPLDSKGNYSATSNNTKLIHWPLMGGLLHLVQRGGT